MTRRRGRRRVAARVGAVLLLAPVLSGCDSLLEPDSRRELGVIRFHGEGPEVTVPDTVAAGEPFTVEVTTWWPDGCASLDETEVRASTSRVDVIPWDRIEEGGSCPDVVERIDHSVTLSRGSPATLTLVVHGRALPADGEGELTVVRELVVRDP